MNINFDLLNKYQVALDAHLKKEKASVWKYKTQESIVNKIFTDNNSSCEEKFHILDTFYSTQIVQNNHNKFDVIKKIVDGLKGIEQNKFEAQDFGVIKTISELHQGKSKTAYGILSFATKYAFHSAKGLGIEDKDNKYVILDSEVLETLKKIGYSKSKQFYDFNKYQEYCNLIGEIQVKMDLLTKRECELLLWKISKYSITI